ncbi:MAG: hypothetical protein KDD29_10200 [Flavobacteriales bacterium]|nr:hypothetical protein [Flavobacteriales bacterium]
MAEINLTQSEADALIAMEKHKANEEAYTFPGLGGLIEMPLTSDNKQENFILSIQRGRINLKKVTYQNRARQVVVLARIDIDGPPHRNPDNKEIPCPHLHIYREGYGDKWAIQAPDNIFSNTADLWITLTEFMKYCNVITIPNIEKDLFI